MQSNIIDLDIRELLLERGLIKPVSTAWPFTPNQKWQLTDKGQRVITLFFDNKDHFSRTSDIEICFIQLLSKIKVLAKKPISAHILDNFRITYSLKNKSFSFYIDRMKNAYYAINQIITKYAININDTAALENNETTISDHHEIIKLLINFKHLLKSNINYEILQQKIYYNNLFIGSGVSTVDIASVLVFFLYNCSVLNIAITTLAVAIFSIYYTYINLTDDQSADQTALFKAPSKIEFLSIPILLLQLSPIFMAGMIFGSAMFLGCSTAIAINIAWLINLILFHLVMPQLIYFFEVNKIYENLFSKSDERPEQYLKTLGQYI